MLFLAAVVHGETHNIILAAIIPGVSLTPEAGRRIHVSSADVGFSSIPVSCPEADVLVNLGH